MSVKNTLTAERNMNGNIDFLKLNWVDSTYLVHLFVRFNPVFKIIDCFLMIHLLVIFIVELQGIVLREHFRIVTNGLKEGRKIEDRKEDR